MTRDQKGFALTDALIAAAIAAGVAVTAAQSIGVAARSARSARELSAVVSEAEIINERINAGLRDDALLDGFTGWTIEDAPFDIALSIGARNETQPVIYVVTRNAPPAFSFERVVIEEKKP